MYGDFENLSLPEVLFCVLLCFPSPITPALSPSILSCCCKCVTCFLSYPNTMSELEQEFGREGTQLKRLFGKVVDFVWDQHGHRINDYLAFWEPLFNPMAQVVAEKGDPSNKPVDSERKPVGR